MINLKQQLDVVDQYTIIHVIDKNHKLLGIRDNLKHGFKIDNRYDDCKVTRVSIDVFGYLNIMIEV